MFDSKSPGSTMPTRMDDDTVAAAPAAATAPAVSPMSEPVPPAVARFRSCRWRRPAENGSLECCDHRDVLPMAGTTGFSPESWCPDCQYYKLRRVPKKRDAGY